MVTPLVIFGLCNVELPPHGRDIAALGKDPVSTLNFANYSFRRMPLASFGNDVQCLPANQDWLQVDSPNFRTKKVVTTVASTYERV